jgi:peptide subunit release factor 1 (eRF1)
LTKSLKEIKYRQYPLAETQSRERIETTYGEAQFRALLNMAVLENLIIHVRLKKTSPLSKRNSFDDSDFKVQEWLDILLEKGL